MGAFLNNSYLSITIANVFNTSEIKIVRILLSLVEVRGIEPLSENLFPKLSTSVVCILTFPYIVAYKQATMLSSS
nr:MAG TPA: hypothetical protein [Caudoviricetes sp.]